MVLHCSVYVWVGRVALYVDYMDWECVAFIKSSQERGIYAIRRDLSYFGSNCLLQGLPPVEKASCFCYCFSSCWVLVMILYSTLLQTACLNSTAI